MFEKFLLRSAAALAGVTLLIGTAGAATIDLVPVGNPGNGNDPETGFGSVAEEYLIGKYEVTAVQYTEFLNAVADADTYGLYNSKMWSSDYGCKIQQSGSSPNYTYSVAADRAQRPVNYVSWGDAARFCNWLHNSQPSGAQGDGTTEDGAYDLNGATSDAELMAITRESDATWFIPTENEWYKPAYHKNDGATANYWDYPTGTDAVPSNDLIDPDPGNNANFYQDGYTIGSPYWTTGVGEFENSESPYDTFDQGGNLWEWNESVVTCWGLRGQRGASFYNNSDMVNACLTGGNYPTVESQDLGFRVGSVPEPGSLTLLVCGLVAAVVWWRRRRSTYSSRSA